MAVASRDSNRRESRMAKSMKTEAWVVYLMTVRGKPAGMKAVCEQSEWEEMERAFPGCHVLVKRGIATEVAAELLARGTSGDPPIRLRRL
jgi:hypothetical protein